MTEQQEWAQEQQERRYTYEGTRVVDRQAITPFIADALTWQKAKEIADALEAAETPEGRYQALKGDTIAHLEARAEAAERERDALKAEVERLKGEMRVHRLLNDEVKP